VTEDVLIVPSSPLHRVQYVQLHQRRSRQRHQHRPAIQREPSPRRRGPPWSLGVSYLVTHGIFLPVRTLKVSQFRVELGERNKRPVAELAATGRSVFQSF
jgi:hypothetical protein